MSHQDQRAESQHEGCVGAVAATSISTRDAMPSLGLPESDGEPVFSEPWQAQAFGMAVSLHDKGVFTWPEWADALAQQIAAAQAAGDADRGDTYYHHWLAALESLVARKTAGPADDLTRELKRHRDAWDRAAHRTPHGQPIVLQPADFASDHG